MKPDRAGVLIRIDGAVHFIPAEDAVAIEHTPRIESVAGAPSEIAGITAYRGEIIPVIALTKTPTRAMIVVRHENELVGLVGAEIVATGIFPEENAPPLDVAGLHGRLKGAAWAGRWSV
jgi:chemotaxis signal transduction protein